MNKAILTDTNGSEIRFSKVQNFDGNVTFRDLSIKHVVKGSETYQTTDSKYLIGQNEYMIGAKNILNVRIDNIEPVVGICIDISEEKIQEVISYNYGPRLDFKNHMTEHAPLKVKYDSNSNKPGAVLRNLGLEFSTDNGTGLP